jgi:3-methyl-2-oxobutanoate hydroxymethyltransferase
MQPSILALTKKKQRGEPIVMLTAYDFTSARLAHAAGVDVILVGDSLGMTIQGHDTTLPVTLDHIIYHTQAVVRGAPDTLVVADLPFMTYQIRPEQALRNAGRVLQETGAQAVKLEGGARMAETIGRLVEAGVPVMGHIGLTPQSVHQLGGWRVQGRGADAAARLLDDARAVAEAGAFALVLELIPADLAARITEAIPIPTIGIGAGPHCDGQVQVFHDILGLLEDFQPKHAKRYAHLAPIIREAIARYAQEVRERAFPTPEHSFGSHRP